MATKRTEREDDVADTANAPPSKKQKREQLKTDNESILANLDLDLNIVVGKNKAPINLNFYNQNMNEIKIDSHIIFQQNPENYAHNILWKNKCIIHKQLYASYQTLIKIRHTDYCHFHQPAPKQMLKMYHMAPVVLQQSQLCGTILYNIHKSIMDTVCEDAYRMRDRKKLTEMLINLEIKNIQHIPTQNETEKDKKDEDVNDFLETKARKKRRKRRFLPDIIEDYGFKNNVFHQLSLELRIAPELLIREYLKCKFGLKPAIAKHICSLLTVAKNLTDVQSNIEKVHGVFIPMVPLHHIHYGNLFDCIRGYNQHIAWKGWAYKVIKSGNGHLAKIYTKSRGRGGHYLEHMLVGKMRGIIAKMNENIKEKKDHFRILNETEQRMKILKLKHEKVAQYKHNSNEEMTDEEALRAIGWRDPPTPDLLFNKGILINGMFVHWMDAKNFLITHQDKVKYRSVIAQSSKYNKIFGNGAIVCLGFVQTHKVLKNDVMFLDASYWE